MKSKVLSFLLLVSLGALLSGSAASGGIIDRICSEGFGGKVQLFQLAKDRNHYGYGVWMRETGSGLRSDYQLKDGERKDSPYEHLNNRLGLSNLPLVTSAGFSQGGYSKPQGIAIQQGEVINRLYSTAMDAIVVLHNGKVKVYNSENQDYYDLIGKSGRMTNYAFRSEFINKAKSEEWTIFQTHLLAYEHELTVSSAARKKIATRKILARIKDASGTQYLAVFYIDSGDYLYDAAAELFDYLTENAYKVDFMINLDTGANDVLEIHNSLSGCRGRTPEGFSSAQMSSNLLAFYFK